MPFPSDCLTRCVYAVTLRMQVRRAVLRLLPKLPVLSTGSSGGPLGASNSLQYPVAELKQPAAAAAKPAGGQGGFQNTGHVQQQQQQHHQGEQAMGQQQGLMQEAATTSGSSGSDSDAGNGNGSSSSSNIAELLRPLGPCPICSTSDILVPFVAHPCRHIFCYYCLQSHCAADSDFQCPVDGERVDALQRYVRPVPVTPG